MTATKTLNDETFKSFVQNNDKTENIQSIEEFQDWKDDFLKTFRDYLNPIGTATAREADEELYIALETLSKACKETKSLIKEGKITPDSSSVKGQRCINEMITLVKNCETSIEAYVPKTKALEKKCGYTKFELAAVLVRDGFRVYGLMAYTRDTLANLVTEGGALSEVLKPNQLTIVMYYLLALEAFTEFMGDLGMYQMMEQCVEIYKIRPRNKKKNKFDRNRNDALDDTTDDEEKQQRKKKKVKPRTPIVVQQQQQESESSEEEEGPMFANKHKDGPKVRSIIDNGWSVGFAPGEEIKDPNRKKNPKKSRDKKKKSKSVENKNGQDDQEDGSTSNRNRNIKSKGNSKDPSSKSKKGKQQQQDDDDDDGNGNDKYNTDTTDDEDEDDEGSSSEDEDDEDEEYIYYFDPVQGVVGKISRAACLKERLILSVDNKKLQTETYEGIVEHWDPKQSDDGSGEMIPGKMDLISTMKEVLRGKAKAKAGGLAE